MKKTKKVHQVWFLVGIIAALIAAPNATVVRYALGSVDPFLFNVGRFLLVAVVMTPFLVRHMTKLRGKAAGYAVRAGLCMSVAVVSYVLAIQNSAASYVSIITLLTPIVFVIYAARITGEKISSRAIAGITLAALGAAVIVVLPIALHQRGQFVFYPLATIYALINVFSFPLSIIYFKRANEAGLPMSSLMSFSSWIVCGVNAVFLLLIGGGLSMPSSGALLAIMYSGIIVALLSRSLSVVAYEHIGSAISGALGYLETLLAIVIPVFVLSEQLSVEMVIGGMLILLGVYIVEHHKSKAHKHFQFFKHH